MSVDQKRIRLEGYITAGLSEMEMSRREGKSRSSTRHWINKFGLQTGRERLPISERSDLYEQARTLRWTGLSYAKIASKLGLGFDAVVDHVNDIPVDARSNNGRRVTDSSMLKSKRAVRDYILRTREYKCETCGIVEWQGTALRLEVHHVDGNSSNNSDSNLQLVCPNCHSQTPNYQSKNWKSGFTPSGRPNKSRRSLPIGVA